MDLNPTDLDSSTDTEPDTDTGPDDEARVEAMADNIAANLYWSNLSWHDRRHRDHIRHLAERLVASGSEPTADDLELLHHPEHDDNTDAREWVARRKAMAYFGHHGADLTSQIKLMRCADIVVTAAASILGLLVLQGLSRILWGFLNYLTALL